MDTPTQSLSPKAGHHLGAGRVTWSSPLCSSRSCYVVFPCQQIVLCLGCLMGLVMFARYGEDSPLDKGYVQTNDQVRHPRRRASVRRRRPLSNLLLSRPDGALLCDGCVQGPAGPAWPLRSLSLLRSAQVGPAKLIQRQPTPASTPSDSWRWRSVMSLVRLLAAPSHQPLTPWRR